MSQPGEPEYFTQQRVKTFFTDALGYAYLGNWEYRDSNTNVEEEYLRAWLQRQGHTDAVINRVLHQLQQIKVVGGRHTLYDANAAVYDLLRYGVKVQPDVGEQHITVWLIDWENPDNNDFAIAEEVTVIGENTRRPDIVLYINGIAVGILELKRSTNSVTKGIRQNISSQKKEFIRPFFATMQLVMAGNETEGLRYGVIETPEKYYLRWKEQDAPPAAGDTPLLRELGQLCSKERLLEIIHDFIVFDAGIKKACRHNQYFGVHAAQDHVHTHKQDRDGGIIWHTQGSGKSLTMVWLAKWLREHMTNARVLLITDREELDEQIEKVFKGVGEDIYRTQSGAGLVNVLNSGQEWLICSLIHKFGRNDDLSEREVDGYVEDIQSHLPRNFRAKGDIYVFVDECHRTQSGKLHRAMQALLPNAMFIGFTGTPLLKRDKQTSLEVFGPYIHTYKYDEAVRDGVVLDLRYEARDIDQDITSEAKVDQWFEAKTRGLSDLAKAQIKQRWGTMQKLHSSKRRLENIASDILMDMELRDRLRSGHGNALLVSDSIYSACRFYEMFQQTPLAGKCAIITSYKPAPGNIKDEDAGEGMNEALLKEDVYRKMLADHFDESEESAMYKVDQFEKDVKKRFIEQPGQMKLLIVVDKLLTGFDAPPATYLYIDKQMQDHGLFQAICRVNRLDGEDKEYGFIVDYMDLFGSLKQSINDYTGEAFDGYDPEDVDGLLTDRLEKGRERLEEMREQIKALCEPVPPPKDANAYRHFFCGPDTSDPDGLKETEPRRLALYKLTASYIRAYANLANEMCEAGYTQNEFDTIKGEVSYYEKIRQEIKLASSDYVDMKVFEPAMRHLLDTYVRAEESEKISAFDDLSLVEIIVERGEDAVDSLPKGIREHEDAMAETIENNVRRLIVDEMAVNPKYYESMSDLLDELIQLRKQKALEYEAYLKRIVDLTRKAKTPDADRYPVSVNTGPRRALYDNLKDNIRVMQESGEAYGNGAPENAASRLAVSVDDAIRSSKHADWRSNSFKQRKVENAIRRALGEYKGLTEMVFELAMNQREY